MRRGGWLPDGRRAETGFSAVSYFQYLTRQADGGEDIGRHSNVRDMLHPISRRQGRIRIVCER